MQLSVVIPAHNEAANLPSLVMEIHEALNNIFEFETIVVDDHSTDGTADELASLQSLFGELKIVRLARRCGQSTALMVGLDHASGQLIATLDGDGQNDPADLLAMATVLFDENPTDGPPVGMVIGHRRQRNDSLWRRICSRIANAVRSRILRDATPDSGCGIKMLTRDAFLKLPRFDHMHRFMPALVRRDGWQVVSISVNHRPRKHGRSHYGTLGRLLAGIIDLIGVTWLLRRSRQPIVEGISTTHDSRATLGMSRIDGPAPVYGPVPDPVAFQRTPRT